MLTALKNRMLELARGRFAEPTLFAVAFAESSFFPIPPDVVLGPMAYANPSKWVRYALTCTIGSVLGGLFGYALGLFLFDTIGHSIIGFFGYGDKEAELRALYDQYGIWLVFVAGLTPIPFKLFTIVSGALSFSLPLFVIGCIISRGARFFLVSWLFQKFGPKMGEMMEKRLGLFSLIIVALVVAAVVVYKLIH